MDKFRIDTLAATPTPQLVAYLAMHQDYSAKYICEMDHTTLPSEEQAGKLVVKHLLKGDRGHYGPLEHPQITVACGYFPHVVMQQLRTHRVGVSFDVQSTRYTSEQIIATVDSQDLLEDVFYIRPVGEYTDRKGHKYIYDEMDRNEHLTRCYNAAELYKINIEQGMSEEHARYTMSYALRQHFVMSANARSLMHILDLRYKLDAELETQVFADKLFNVFKLWMPEVASWYEDKRLGKGKLAP